MRPGGRANYGGRGWQQEISHSNKTMAIRKALSWLIIPILLGVTACSAIAPTGQVDAPATYSPEQQAAIQKARQMLASSRLEFQSPPQLIAIEETDLEAAQERMTPEGAEPPPTKNQEAKMQVWLALFAGELRIIPPDPSHTLTPPPFTHRCVYVLVNPKTHEDALSTAKCPPP